MKHQPCHLNSDSGQSCVSYLLSKIPVNQLVNSLVLNLGISDPTNGGIQMPTQFGQHKIWNAAHCIRKENEKRNMITLISDYTVSDKPLGRLTEPTTRPCLLEILGGLETVVLNLLRSGIYPPQNIILNY